MSAAIAPSGHRTPPPNIPEIDILWVTGGLSCDGDTIAMTAATQPSLEDIVLGAIPGLPQVRLHNPVLAYENGAEFLRRFHLAAEGKLAPFLLVIEGSIPNEKNKAEGYWAGFGTDQTTGQPILTCDWIDRLAPRAWAVVAIGTCAAYGGIHAMAGNPTGCMGLADYLGWDWKSTSTGIPIVNVPGCPVQPDNFMQTLLYLLRQAAGQAPMIPLDEQLRPRWLFTQTVHEGCDRGGYYEQAEFARDYGTPECIVKLGCWGPVVQCNVGKRGWMNGIGGCPNVGGVCIGCTMPGFPDKFMPFLDMPPGAHLSSTAVSLYGRTVRALRRFTRSFDEPRAAGAPPRSYAWREGKRSDPMTTADEFQGRVQRIELLVEALESCTDATAREGAREVVRALLDLHRLGLARVLELAAESGAAGPDLLDRLAQDELAGSLLLLHGMHPLDLEARVARAVERLQPRLGALGGALEVLGVDGATVRLRLRHGSSPDALRRLVEEALVTAAPDAETILVEEAPDGPPSPSIAPLVGSVS